MVTETLSGAAMAKAEDDAPLQPQQASVNDGQNLPQSSSHATNEAPMAQPANGDAKSDYVTSSAENINTVDSAAVEFKSNPQEPSERKISIPTAENVENEKDSCKSAEGKCENADVKEAEAQAKSSPSDTGSVNVADDDKMSHTSEKPKGTDSKIKELQQSVQRIDGKLDSWKSQLREAGVLDSESEEPDDEPETEQKKRLPAIPKLLYVDWQKFKHRVVGETVHAVEILIGPAKYYYEREEEEQKHRVRKMQLKKASAGVPEGNASQQLDPGISGDLPERVRINSMPILAILGNIDSEDKWSQDSNIILCPFKPLVYSGRQIRSTLQSLETDWGEAEKEAGLENSKDTPGISTDPINGEENMSQVVGGNDPTNPINGEENTSQVVGGNNPTSPINGEENTSKNVAESVPTENKITTNPSAENHLNESTVEQERSHKIGEHAKQDNSSSEKSSEDTADGVTKDEPEDLANSIEALRDLRCLVSFMDKHLDPVVTRYTSNDCQKVSFNDLWHLFKPGELICGPLGSSRAATEVSVDIEGVSKISSSKDVDRFQEVWRVVSTADGRANLRALQNADAENQTSNELPDSPRVNPFRVIVYHVDFDGSFFLPVSSQINIYPFKGYKDITSLSVYPLRFAKNQAELRSKWLARGRRFREYVTPRHLYYEGRSITSRPEGYQNEADAFPRYSGNIDSEVVVDFKEALSTHPDWKNAIVGDFVTMKTLNRREFSDDFPIYSWSEGGQPKVVSTFYEYGYIDRRIDEKMMESARGQDGLARNIPDKALQEDWKLGDEHLILLPNRVYAFVLKYRKFALVSVDGLRPVHTDRSGFNDLKLQTGHKEIVASLVSEHFRKKAEKGHHWDTSYDSDIVRGKGKGLIVLLHGAPGVGKTSTAECIAEEYRKPLFPVTCGDLGLTAAEVERELQEKFHLAELWDCVLLLDEADVFLAERTRHDIQRNSLVSVFLRVLEYFTGILFLTTNRVGTFDEAFTSRIHLSLYYPPLEWPQSQSIWEVNMNRLKDNKRRRNELIKIDAEQIFEYASLQFEESRRRKRQWNGRQIRNAFQIASALAEYEAYDSQKAAEKAGFSAPLQPHLKVEHFRVVARASTEFDEYLYKTRGVSYSRAALQGSFRNDEYTSSNSTPIYYRQQRPATPASSSFPSHPAGRFSQIHTGGGPQPRYLRPPQPYTDSRSQDEEHQYQRMHGVEGEVDDGNFGQSYEQRDSWTLWPMTEDYDRVEASEAMGKFGGQAPLAPRQRGQARAAGGPYYATPYAEEYHEHAPLH